jgi:hypothetical protein
MDGGSYYFARPLTFSRAQLKTISGLEDTDRIGGASRYSAWMQNHGGVPDADLIIRLVVAGNRRQPVRILNIAPVGTCTAPLTGTEMNSPSAGDDTTDYIAFNLDDKQPVADAYKNGGFEGSYFDRTTVSLRYTEQQVFLILAQTYKHYCQFRLQFSVLDGTKVITETIGNARQPFRVSGPAPVYKEVYNGGIAGGFDGRFVKFRPHRP